MATGRPLQTHMVAAIWSGGGCGPQCLKVSWVAPLKGTLWEASRDPRHLHAGSMYAAPQGRIHACVSPSQASVWDIYIYIYISEPHTPFRWILIVMGTSPIYTGYTGYTRYSRYLVLQCLDILAQQRSGLFCDHLDVWPK